MLGGLIGAALLAIGLVGATTAMADDHEVPVANPTVETITPSDVRGEPWICIDLGYQYGYTVAQNIPNSQEAFSVETTIVNNGKNVLGKGTPEDPTRSITVTSENGVTFSWQTADSDQGEDFPIGAVVVKGSNLINVYRYDPAMTSGSGLTTPQGKKINQVTFCWGEGVEPPPPLASLTVTKIVNGLPVDAKTEPPFTFSIAEGETGFEFELNNQETSAVYGIAAGVPTTVTEVLGKMPAGYAFENLSCDVTDPDLVPAEEPTPATQVAYEGHIATITAIDGAVIHCTYTNTKLPTIQVKKQVVGDGAPADASFPFLVNANGFNLTAGGESAVYTVPVGAGTVSETVASLPANFALTGASCTVGQGNVDLATGTVGVDLKAGENTVCTFTNTYTAPPGETTGTPEAPPAVVTQVRRPRLAIVKTGPLRARGLQKFTYTIRVRNPGKAVARNVVVTDALPTGLSFIKASRKATVKGRTITIPMGNLQPGKARTVKVTVRAAANIRGRKVNVAVARATNVRPVRDTAATVFRPLVRRVVPAVTG
jgi:uncharacterized repeat protein (TIGR01451 family)